MKKYLLIFIILLYSSVSYSQEKSLKHEVEVAYGIFNFPNDMLNDNGMKGGFTANYMYRIKRWFWVGANVNWQFPSDSHYYYWREYYADGSFKDFEKFTVNRFFAFAPEMRLSYTNKKWVTLYSSFSAGYGINTGIKLHNDFCNNYYYWNITFFGGNWYFGKKQHFFFGGEFGIGFKGIYSIHAGYRF